MKIAIKTDLFKNGASVSFEKSFPYGLYTVTIRAPDGCTHRRIRTDDYQAALEYQGAFRAIAKNL